MKFNGDWGLGIGEFAFEGLRFNDLRRWSGKGAGEGSLAAKALQAQDGKKIGRASCRERV